MRLMSFLLFVGLMFVGIAVNQGLKSSPAPYAPLASINTLKNSEKFTQCELFWEAQNEEIEKAKKAEFEDEELFAYFKSLAIGIAYQNCITRNGK